MFHLYSLLEELFFFAVEKTIHLFLFALAFKIDEKASDYEHYPSILVSFLGKTEHFSVKNGVF